MAIEIIRQLEEKLPGSDRWNSLTKIEVISAEDAEIKLTRLRRAMPMSQFRCQETRYDPQGIEDDDIPF